MGSWSVSATCWIKRKKLIKRKKELYVPQWKNYCSYYIFLSKIEALNEKSVGISTTSNFETSFSHCSTNSSPRQDLSENWVLKGRYERGKRKTGIVILRVGTTMPVRRLTSSLLYMLKINTKYCWKEYKINCQRHPDLTIKRKLYLSLGSDFPLSFRSTQWKSKSPGFDPTIFWQILLWVLLFFLCKVNLRASVRHFLTQNRCGSCQMEEVLNFF